MFCCKCGAKNQDDYIFCTMCGTRLQPEQPKADATIDVKKPSVPQAEPQESTKLTGEVFTYSEGQFAYARIASQTKTGKWYCECIDGVSAFFIDPDHAKRPDNTPASIGDYIWARLTEFTWVKQEKNRYKVGRYYDQKFDTKSETILFEYNLFKQYYKCGDILLASISDVREACIVVRLSPVLTAVCYPNTLPRNVQVENLTADSIQRFSVHKFDDEKNRVVLKLQETVVEDKKSIHLWSQLPGSMKDVIIPGKMLSVIDDQDIVDSIVEKPGDPLNRKALLEFLEPIYQKEYAAKRITVKQTATTYFMDFDTGLKNAKGVPMSAAFKKPKKDPKGDSRWVLNLFGFTSMESVFDRYVYVKDMDAAAEELANLALSGEDWDYGGAREKGKKYILKQYLRVNFYKSWLDGLLVINERGEAVFNTGLVDGAYDDIYCYLKRNTQSADFFSRRWELDCFACWGKGKNGKNLNRAFTTRPKVPQYIDPNRIQDIYYNITRELSCDYDHIVEDNLSRLPLDFIAGELSRYEEVTRAINAYKASNSYDDFERLRDLIISSECYLRRITEGLRQSVQTAIKYSKWNYKTAIPIYYPRNNTVSLLLPLCLTNDSNVADVALVVERLANGNYQGQTILTLRMAYLDARQICRPNSEWLTVDSISQGADELDEE